jgi:DNA-binding response OmpR family regulator
MERTGALSVVEPAARLDPPVDVREERPLPHVMADGWLTEPPVVLIVDDDEDLRDTLSMMLEHEGMTTLQANSAEEALALLAQQHPGSREQISAVLLDVMLPDRSGLDVCRALKDRAAGRNLPVIMLTALGGVADEVDGILAGADGYLVKPIGRAQLLLWLREVI